MIYATPYNMLQNGQKVKSVYSHAGEFSGTVAGFGYLNVDKSNPTKIELVYLIRLEQEDYGFVKNESNNPVFISCIVALPNTVIAV